MSYPIDGSRRTSTSRTIEPERKVEQSPEPKRCCWGWCYRKVKPIQQHERQLTVHEIDYAKILRAEAAFNHVNSTEKKI